MVKELWNGTENNKTLRVILAILLTVFFVVILIVVWGKVLSKPLAAPKNVIQPTDTLAQSEQRQVESAEAKTKIPQPKKNPEKPKYAKQDNVTGDNETNEITGNNSGNIGGENNTAAKNVFNAGNGNTFNDKVQVGDTYTYSELELSPYMKQLLVNQIEATKAKFASKTKKAFIYVSQTSNAGKLAYQTYDYLKSQGYEMFFDSPALLFERVQNIIIQYAQADDALIIKFGDISQGEIENIRKREEK